MKSLIAILAGITLSLAIATVAEAQCPGGVCPYQSQARTSAEIPRRIVSEQLAMQLSGPHWTYPGEIHNHLSTGHGVNAAGMSRAQAEAEHDRLHNAARQSRSQFTSGSGSVAKRQKAFQVAPRQSQQRFRLFGRRR